MILWRTTPQPLARPIHGSPSRRPCPPHGGMERFSLVTRMRIMPAGALLTRASLRVESITISLSIDMALVLDERDTAPDKQRLKP